MTKSEKQSHLLKLMVIAMNAAINRGVIDLNGVSVIGSNDDKSGHMEMIIAGRPSIISWYDAGYDELRISVWWDYRPDLMPTYRKKFIGRHAPGVVPVVPRRFFRYILGACGSCYLERRAGKFIIGEKGAQFFSTYLREDSVYELEQIKSEKPAGYRVYGRVPV